ncbi:hypothetical protein G3M58_92045, partial [Streptomyces sp. SID7499]|nr:hypothetical protein [Streptomyces sp. SID7499]
EVDAWFRGVLAGTRHYLYEEARETAEPIGSASSAARRPGTDAGTGTGTGASAVR